MNNLWRQLRRFCHVFWWHHLRLHKPVFPRTADEWVQLHGGPKLYIFHCECGRFF